MSEPAGMDFISEKFLADEKAAGTDFARILTFISSLVWRGSPSVRNAGIGMATGRQEIKRKCAKYAGR